MDVVGCRNYNLERIELCFHKRCYSFHWTGQEEIAGVVELAMSKITGKIGYTQNGMLNRQGFAIRVDFASQMRSFCV